jgi:predicted DNA-binding transcriptional regulator YafY
VSRANRLLAPLMFTDEELEALVLELRLAAEHADAGLAGAATEAGSKLRAVLPRELRAAMDDTALLAGPARQRIGRPRTTLLAEWRAREGIPAQLPG